MATTHTMPFLIKCTIYRILVTFFLYAVQCARVFIRPIHPYRALNVFNFDIMWKENCHPYEMSNLLICEFATIK